MNESAKILIVDDDNEVREVTSFLLNHAGYHTLTANSGSLALNLIRTEQPDLVLLDFIMPGMNGDEVCRKIKADDELRDTFVVFCSHSKTASDDKAYGLEAGADGYIVRPVANRELLAQVDAMLRIKRTQDQLREAKADADRLNAELQHALAQVKRLHGLLPICMHCHKVRRDSDSWQELVSYVIDHSEAEFSHGVCPECMAQYYPKI